MDRKLEIIELRRRDEAAQAAKLAGEGAAIVTARILIGVAEIGAKGLVMAYEEVEHRTWRMRHQARIGATFTLSYLRTLPKAVVAAGSEKLKKS